MKWITDNFGEDSTLDDLLDKLSVEYFSLKQASKFTDTTIDFINWCVDDLVLFHGSLQFAKKLNRESNCKTYCDFDKFLCTNYYPHYARFLLNYPYALVTYGDLLNKTMQNKILSSFGNDGCVFVRPNGGDKKFTGQVIDIRDWERQVKNLGFYDVDQNELVLVSEPVNIKAEWRLWIGNGKVIGSSMYKPLKMEGCPAEVIEYAERVASVYQPETLFVMDIAQCYYEYNTYPTFKLVEINSFGCSGFYKVDLATMIPKAMEIAEEEYRKGNDEL